MKKLQDVNIVATITRIENEGHEDWEEKALAVVKHAIVNNMWLKSELINLALSNSDSIDEMVVIVGRIGSISGPEGNIDEEAIPAVLSTDSSQIKPINPDNPWGMIPDDGGELVSFGTEVHRMVINNGKNVNLITGISNINNHPDAEWSHMALALYIAASMGTHTINGDRKSSEKLRRRK